MNERHIWSTSNPSRWRRNIFSARDWSLSRSVGRTRIANENWVSFASETRVTDTEYSPAAISCIAASATRKSGIGSRGSRACSGIRRTWTVASVMIPRRPSLPSTISRMLGPVEVAGTGRVTSVPDGVTTRSPLVMSAMSP